MKLLPSVDRPLIARAADTTWLTPPKWNLDTLSDKIEGKLKFRMGRKVCANPQWESEAAYLHMSECSSLAPLKTDILWNCMFPCFPNAGESTFWLGTSGSHTICHYDTYGVNFVMQICGRKRWTLFSPADTSNLYPTRIPLEESTVFSQVNIQTPDVIKYPKILDAHPQIVTLETGDVLFVPRHWWHFVESLGPEEATCAVNMWLDQPILDNKERCKEALTQIACFSLLDSSSSIAKKINYLHEAELELAQSSDWFQVLASFIQSSVEFKAEQKDDKSPVQKCFKTDRPIQWKTLSFSRLNTAQPNPIKNPLSSQSNDIALPESIFQAFLDPEVIELVYHKMTTMMFK